jgi:hypothetical protein
MKHYSILVTLILVLTLAESITATKPKYDQWFDDYGRISWPEEQGRLDNFAHFLQVNPSYIGFIAIYRGPGETKKYAENRILKIKKHLIRKRKIDGSRLIFYLSEKELENSKTILQPSARDVPPIRFPD